VKYSHNTWTKNGGRPKTKNILLKGYPAVIFCTAGLKIDEQEATRFLLLSPETNQEKIREAIYEKLKKETDKAAYQEWLEGDLKRQLLIKRIRAIKQECINEIKIGRPEKNGEVFSKIKRHSSLDIPETSGGSFHWLSLLLC
jgi:hypothetical protein